MSISTASTLPVSSVTHASKVRDLGFFSTAGDVIITMTPVETPLISRTKPLSASGHKTVSIEDTENM